MFRIPGLVNHSKMINKKRENSLHYTASRFPPSLQQHTHSPPLSSPTFLMSPQARILAFRPPTMYTSYPGRRPLNCRRGDKSLPSRFIHYQTLQSNDPSPANDNNEWPVPADLSSRHLTVDILSESSRQYHKHEWSKGVRKEQHTDLLKNVLEWLGNPLLLVELTWCRGGPQFPPCPHWGKFPQWTWVLNEQD